MVDKMQLKRRLEKPNRHNEHNGTLEDRYSESLLRQCARQAIAQALFTYHLHDLKQTEQEASVFFNETDIVVSEMKDETETLPLLEQGLLMYPDFSQKLSPFKNTLNHLFCIWTVSGYHRKEPTKCVEMLIGGYWTNPSLVPLGRRDGYSWVSPVYPCTQ